MSKAILLPMLLLRRGPGRWDEQQALLLPAQWRVTMAAVEAVTGANLGTGDRDELGARLSILLAHLLKWEFQADKRNETWQATIQAQRLGIVMLVMRRPGLARYARRILGQRYRAALARVMTETGLDASAFPEDCPYRTVQILDSGYLPAPA